MMLSTDPIADMLSRIRNSILTKSRSVTVPYSRSKYAVLKVLSDAGWLGGIELQGQPPRTISVTIKYDEQGSSVIRSIKRISVPGRRMYVGRTELPIVVNNFGIAVISTSQGMMSNREARRRKLGGEVMCEVF
ncbi:MAG: 30S ribosomal protein S8 [Candidatus Kerfeldbacteria bacterium]